MKIQQKNIHIVRFPQLKDGTLYQFESGPHQNTVFVVTDGELFLFSGKGVSRHHEADDGIDGERYRIYTDQLILEN